MFSVNIEGKDEKLTVDVKPLKVEMSPRLEEALTKFLEAAADFLAWVRRP